MAPALDISVVIPTIGRTRSLRACLESIAASTAPPAEVVLVDQSRDTHVADLAGGLEGLSVRVVPCSERGISVGLNLGIREARHELVLVTHDDCTVAEDWVETGFNLMSADGDRLVTGRVRPAGDPRMVSVFKDHPKPQDFTGHRYWGGLMAMNMAFPRSLVLEFGGFDERFTIAAEEIDFSYRWLIAGRRLHYLPELVVSHHDTRTPEELERLYVGYWYGHGRFYAKHLWRGDGQIVRAIARDLLWNVPQAIRDAIREGKPRWMDPRREILRGLPRGLAAGIWEFRPDRRKRVGRVAQRKVPR